MSAETFQLAAAFYILGQGMDAVDGVAARHFKQTSRFGVVLDMLSDRMGQAALLVVLSHLYPSAWGFFTFLLVLDMVSHWCQMYSRLSQNKASHKGGKSALLNFYYSFPALFIFCSGNEFFFTSLYLLAFDKSPIGTFAGVELPRWRLAAYVTFPLFAFKNMMNVVQLHEAVTEIAEIPEPKSD